MGGVSPSRPHQVTGCLRGLVRVSKLTDLFMGKTRRVKSLCFFVTRIWCFNPYFNLRPKRLRVWHEPKPKPNEKARTEPATSPSTPYVVVATNRTRITQPARFRRIVLPILAETGAVGRERNEGPIMARSQRHGRMLRATIGAYTGKMTSLGHSLRLMLCLRVCDCHWHHDSNSDNP